ncbi:MAG TPA: hypothetical protein VE714_04825 [Gemmatimonadales bacterium]|jgi:hypothetical protein|nr:hypothetical protein [Gemmatimonadales bacterium]
MKSILWVVPICFLAACGSGAGNSSQTVNRDTLTERQRDSVLAGSQIPGARGVGSAMRAADSTNAKVLQTDTVARDTTEL